MRVVVWLKIREHDILNIGEDAELRVVVWLKIREHDIVFGGNCNHVMLWFD